MIKVLIVDDSALIRQVFETVLSDSDGIEVVGTARDAYEAREKIKKLNPDVLTLDIEMPKMDGIAFLEKIMTLRPMPVIMVSTLTQKGADTTIKALELGAIDYVAKPTSGHSRDNISALKEELVEKIKIAASSKVRAISKRPSSLKEELKLPLGKLNRTLIAIGSSTGGVEALKDVLTLLPANTPPVVVVQHMPEKFTQSFASRLDGLCKMRVHEAVDGQKIEAGNVYIARGGTHLRIEKNGVNYVCRVGGSDNISGHCPSVDVLFESVAKLIGNKAIGVILTGMGRDGATNMLKMKQMGAINIGQDEQSCVVYGMPKEAKNIGALHIQVPLSKVAEEIVKKCSQ